MTNAHKIGCTGTDDLTGRVVVLPVVSGEAILTGTTGVALQARGANYQVTAGKTLHLTAVVYHQLASARGKDIHLCYADDAAQTTNRVLLGHTQLALPANAPPPPYPLPLCGLTVPAGKYLGVYNSSAGQEYPCMLIIGYEE